MSHCSSGISPFLTLPTSPSPAISTHSIPLIILGHAVSPTSSLRRSFITCDGCWRHCVMDGSVSDFTHTAPVQRFLSYFRENCEKGHCSVSGEPAFYLPESKLKEYFADKHTLQAILKAILPHEKDLHNVRQQIRRHYTKCFAILLYIGHPRLIVPFVEAPYLADSRLPFDACPPTFPFHANRDQLFQRFYEYQWAFCAPILHYRTFTLRSELILPFTILGRIEGGEGGTSETFKIEVHPEYDKLSSSDRVRAPILRRSSYGFKDITDPNLGSHCRFPETRLRPQIL
jgi:hypothetical protein